MNHEYLVPDIKWIENIAKKVDRSFPENEYASIEVWHRFVTNPILWFVTY